MWLSLYSHVLFFFFSRAFIHQSFIRRLAIYSSRFASWQHCTVLSVDHKKGLHAVKYEETGVQKWHKLSDNQVSA